MDIVVLAACPRPNPCVAVKVKVFVLWTGLLIWTFLSRFFPIFSTSFFGSQD